jgi:ClpP class serine protease
MPAWNQLLAEIDEKSPVAALKWLEETQKSALQQIGQLRADKATGKPRNVILYGTAFLQKPLAANATSLTHEEINGLMSVMFGMTWDHGLTLILHTPGGITNAAETFVDYIRKKFPYVEVIVPTYAMSAGTMISLGADCIVMGKQSQLGPIDPQMPIGGTYVSASSIVDLFEKAKADIVGPGGNLQAAHVWAPILQSMGPAVLQEATYAIQYGEDMVARWLEKYMMAPKGKQAKAEGARIAKHFNATSTHKSHGRRIDRDEVRTQGLNVEDLEATQELQDAVLTAYHLMTILFEKTPAAKILLSDAGRLWIKNVPGDQQTHVNLQ